MTAQDLLQAPEVRALISYLDHETAPMIVMNTDYQILAANTAYKRQFAIVGKPYLGHKCHAISHQFPVPCDQAGEHCPLQSALATRAPERVLHIHHTPRGPEHVDVELRPIIDAGHRVIGFVERLQTVRQASARANRSGLVGQSAAFNRALGELQRVAPSALPVLLLGESGTGKELFARALHEASTRSGGPFVVMDCSGLSETLFESEVFGYEKGAFTGALARKAGLAETANGGTLFLDEIGDVPLSMQVKLLRLIESGTYRRVGGVETLRSDFRLVAATHKPLERMVDDGQFRQDLYYRIAAFPLRLPALRERQGDIGLLVESLLQRSGATGVRLAPDALAALEDYHWPGNIRELRNVIERARLFADDGDIKPVHLGLTDRARVRAPATLDDDGFAAFAQGFHGTRKALALALGCSERTLYRRLKQVGLA
ncbi:MAG: sigma-54-dependent Fis family transcriptional regulator [Burkholderiaceae bacterium]|nr:sigma-54-dependent Fis family transcriptional regulator [Burkholderiaceae bacterium]